jgi:hypothetical protein
VSHFSRNNAKPTGSIYYLLNLIDVGENENHFSPLQERFQP